MDLAPNGPTGFLQSFPEEPWTDACRSKQCTSSFQLLDEAAARKGALCEKLEPVLHAFSAFGSAVCAPDDVNDALPCITNAVSVAQRYIEDVFGHGPPAQDSDSGEHALFSSEQHVLLRAFRDLVGLREGPSEVVRALVARMPGSHGVERAPKLRKVVHHAQRHQVIHHAHHRHGRARVLNVHRPKRFLLNQAPLALAQFGDEKLDMTQTLDSFCTPCMDSILSAAAGVVSALAPYAEAVPPHALGPYDRADPRDFVLMAQYLPATCQRASSTGDVCIAAPIGAMSSGASLKEFAEPKAVCGEC